MTGTFNIPVSMGTPAAPDPRPGAREDLRKALKLKPGKKVLVFGGYGTSNVGDDAILAGLLSTLPDGVIPTVVSMRPEETERIHGVHAIAPLRAPLELLSHSAVIIGGGGIFSGHMGQMSRLLPVMSLIAWLARKRVAYYGVGVYTSTPNWVRKTLRLAMRKADFVTVRDTPSIETLTAMGVKAELRPDLATLLEPKPFPASAMRAFERKPGRPLVGLCLTATDTALGEAMDRAVPEVVSRMPDADFVFIPMSQHPVINSHNDMLMAMAIQESAPRMRILDGYHHPGAVMDAIGRLDAAVCMRFHSMVFAERMGTPIVPVSYAEKTLSWLEERGVQSVEPNAETLTGAIRRALSSRRVSEAV